MTGMRFLLCSLTLASTAAHAAPLPDPVRAMIEAAVATGVKADIDAVVRIARQTNPDAGAEIDALLGKTAPPPPPPTPAVAVPPPPAADLEPKPRRGLVDGWTGRGEAGGFSTGGNSDSTGISGAVALSRIVGKFSLGFNGNADYQRSNGITSTEQFLAELQPRYQLGEHVFLYGLARWDRDRLSGLSSRWAASGGLGYRFINTDELKLSVRGGPAWQRTDFTGQPSSSQLTGLGALDFSWQFTPRLRLTETASTLIGGNNTNLISTTGLEAKLGSKLSARLSYLVDYDTNPPPGANDTDTISRITIVYDF